jgi:hypothetical protein
MFSLCITHFNAMPESLNTPPLLTTRHSNDMPLANAMAVAFNTTVPSLSEQFPAKPPSQLAAAVVLFLGQVKQGGTIEDATTTNSFWPNSPLGNLAHAFDLSLRHLPTDEEIAALKSRVVVIHEGIMHVLYCGSLEAYSLDNLRNCAHSFENVSDLPYPQTNLMVMVSYPQGRNYFSYGVSMILRGGGDVAICAKLEIGM